MQQKILFSDLVQTLVRAMAPALLTGALLCAPVHAGNSKPAVKFDLAEFQADIKRLNRPTSESIDINHLDIRPRQFRALVRSALPGLQQTDFSKLEQTTLEQIFATLDMLNFYTHDAALLALQERALNAMPAQDQSNERVQAIYRNYLHTGDFAGAAAWQRAHTEIIATPPPRVEMNSLAADTNRYLLAPTEDGSAWNAEPAGWNEGVKVFVLSFQDCPMAKRLRSFLSAEPELRNFFGRHATWIYPPSKHDDQGWMREANSDTTLGINRKIHQLHDWPELPALLSPSLLFVRDGQLVHAEYGWGPDSPGDVRAVIAKLQNAQ